LPAVYFFNWRNPLINLQNGCWHALFTRFIMKPGIYIFVCT